jgi:nitrite reductase/ring-hydroxylating ferredoxin subunit
MDQGLQKSSKDVLVSQLTGEGFRFSSFTMTSEGDYSADDADWNYKDIPHLHEVHALAESHPAVVGRDINCSVNLQRILGIWFPITLVNFEYEKNRQVYYTTLLFFVLIIETRIEPRGPIRCAVHTNYSIGSSPWMFFLIPVLKMLVKRNYRVLMSEDIPMRTRKGELRKLGYSFRKDGETYSFIGTRNIMKENLCPPQGVSNLVRANYVAMLDGKQEALAGDGGLLGFRLIRDADSVVIYPRACPHEGSSLDKSSCSGGFVKCRWHGRQIAPIGRFRWGENTQFSTKAYRGEVAGETITVEYLPPETRTGRAPSLDSEAVTAEL